MANLSAKFDQEAHNGVVAIVFTSLFPYMSIVTLTFDLWPPKLIEFILLPWLTCLPSLIKKYTMFSFYCVHKLISIYVHCDHDLWPLTSKINRVHPLIMVNMSAKFDKETWNGVVSIVFTRSTDGRTDRRTHGTTAALLYPHRNALRGDNKGWILGFVKYNHVWTYSKLLCIYFKRQPQDCQTGLIRHAYQQNGSLRWAYDETSLISSEVKCMGLCFAQTKLRHQFTNIWHKCIMIMAICNSAYLLPRSSPAFSNPSFTSCSSFSVAGVLASWFSETALSPFFILETRTFTLSSDDDDDNDDDDDVVADLDGPVINNFSVISITVILIFLHMNSLNWVSILNVIFYCTKLSEKLPMFPSLRHILTLFDLQLEKKLFLSAIRINAGFTFSL